MLTMYALDFFDVQKYANSAVPQGYYKEMLGYEDIMILNGRDPMRNLQC